MTPAELKQARKTLGLTQAELATALRMGGKRSSQTISDWETGRDGASPDATACELVRAYLSGYRPSNWPR